MAEKVTKLMEQIEHKELVLPEFQREFQWKRTQVRNLFESLFKDYPSGSLLVWVTDDPPKIRNDAYDLEKVRRVKVLLDGQQRLTSLYLHIRGEVPPYYLPREIKDNYFDLYFNLKSGEFSYYKRLQMQDNPLWIRLADFFGSRPKVYRLLNQLGIDDPDEKDIVGAQLESNIDRLRDIKKYEYPVQTVPSNARIREAIKVFDLINSQGTPLTQADITLAYMTAEWPEIRQRFKDKIEQLKGDNFTLNLTFMTRCMVGIVDGTGELARFGEVTESELQESWKKLDVVLDYLISFLRNEAYIIGNRDLSTRNVLVPLVVYLARHDWFKQREALQFLYWMYAALYQRRYSGSLETKLDQDISSLLAELDPNALIANLKEDEGDPVISPSNLDMRGVGHPLYNMMSIVIRARGGVDWANGLALADNAGASFKLQRHHIFPKSVLGKVGWDTGKSQYHKKRVHEIANRIPLTKQGNLDIFDKPPAEYLPIVEERYPGVLRSSLIPENENLWHVENYEAFLERRRQLIAEAINEYMASLLTEEPADGPGVRELIEEGESQAVEFKARLRGGSGSYHLQQAVVKAVAGMLNAEGGKVLLGVADDGSVIGLEADYETLGKKNRDGFEVALSNLLSGRLGANFLPLIQIGFDSVEGHDVCIITADPSYRPVYVREGNDEVFYLRTQNATRPLDLSEATEYIKDHFG
jgi:hypothetical protein